MDLADLIQSGGVAALAIIVWHELRAGLQKVSESIDKMSDKLGSGICELRKDMASQREELAKSTTITQERIGILAKLSEDRASRALSRPIPTDKPTPSTTPHEKGNQR